jgi:predicted phage terminase large subunit-like protein
MAAPPEPNSRGLRGSDLIVLARMDFLAFAILMFPVLHDDKEMIPAPYLDVIAEVLMNTRRDGPQRLIFNLPPGHMKSLLISILYTAWRLGVNPSERIICASYSDDLAHQLSRLTRQVMQSSRYRRIFPGTVLDKKAQDSLTTTKGGQRYATSVTGPIAGFRADLIVIDDPMQPNEVASENAKQKLRDWYYGVVLQRLLPGGVIVLVMHRLAPDDLTATLVEDGGWRQFALPLIATATRRIYDKRDRTLMLRAPGDLLNPDWLTAEAVEKLRASLPPHIFEAQYQQNPQWGGSGICTIDRFARYAEAPPFELMIHSWDLAATQGGGDFTVCAKFGLAKDPSGRDILYLTEVVRMRVQLPDVRDHIAAIDEAEKPALIIMDGVGIGMGVCQDLTRLGLKHIMPSGSMQKENVGSLKTIRFHTAVPAIYDGLVRIPDSMPGLEILLAEFAAFPDGKNDDQVDAIGNVAANLAYVVRFARQYAERFGRFWSGRPVAPRPNPPPKSRDQELYDRRRTGND